MSLTREITKAHEILNTVKIQCERNSSSMNFNATSTAYHMGYYQAHKDMLARIEAMERK